VAAEQAERAHLERVMRGERDEPVPSRTAIARRKEDALTVSRFVDEIWWPKYKTGGGKRGVNSPTTIMEKETHLRVHIVPALGALPLVDVSNEVLTDFFGKLREDGYRKKGRAARSTKTKVVQKRIERSEGRKDRGKARVGLCEKSVRTSARRCRPFSGSR
jgi:hypothetical protein